ncbi:hypothetical protein DH2020_007146 [Rehmannia glutinosa]|uniref:porphobilinogen synthase n=1 Tax=Rehmannia glutinosa TaxID=99300 RepID=A0ABR0TXD6_REHGL
MAIMRGQIIRLSVVMASMMLNSVNFSTSKAVKFDYVGLKPLKVHQNILCVRPHSIKIAPRMLTIRASEIRDDGTIKKMGMSDEECEAAVVAGIFQKHLRCPQTSRASWHTGSCPLFSHDTICAGEEDTPIGAMPGCYRLGWRHGLVEEVAKARDVGVNSIVLFPKVPDALKNSTGDEAYNENGLVPRSIRLLKDKYPDLVIYLDVALDPYSSDGHDGIVREDGVIMNDETVHQLCKQAVAQARAGADVVSPSDMMDGRVGAIRAALDAEGFQHVSIMSYTAKRAGADIILTYFALQAGRCLAGEKR